jgi:hypothetical protein
LAPEDREALRLDGSLVIRVAALENLPDACAVRVSTREAVSFTAVAQSGPSRPERDVSKAAESAFNEFARFKISEVSPFWPASKTVGRTVERNMAAMFLFIVL